MTTNRAQIQKLKELLEEAHLVALGIRPDGLEPEIKRALSALCDFLPSVVEVLKSSEPQMCAAEAHRLFGEPALVTA